MVDWEVQEKVKAVALVLAAQPCPNKPGSGQIVWRVFDSEKPFFLKICPISNSPFEIRQGLCYFCKVCSTQTRRAEGAALCYQKRPDAPVGQGCYGNPFALLSADHTSCANAEQFLNLMFTSLVIGSGC